MIKLVNANLSIMSYFLNKSNISGVCSTLNEQVSLFQLKVDFSRTTQISIVSLDFAIVHKRNASCGNSHSPFAKSLDLTRHSR